ncbi:hypothetical protein LIER_42977 [Lithospermum erythrorhizon]|uniref:Uncharacterized protein n=1 Tax=Lithospermum erythrorhizon TaxID=34254 RepID=A0AAV3P8R4_LITER
MFDPVSALCLSIPFLSFISEEVGGSDNMSTLESAFVPGRSLTDSVLLLQELVYHKEDGIPKMAIKVDL